MKLAQKYLGIMEVLLYVLCIKSTKMCIGPIEFNFLAKSYCAIRFWHACHNNYTVLHVTNVLLKFVVILIYGLICRLKGGDLMNTCIILPV